MRAEVRKASWLLAARGAELRPGTGVVAYRHWRREASPAELERHLLGESVADHPPPELWMTDRQERRMRPKTGGRALEELGARASKEDWRARKRRQRHSTHELHLGGTQTRPANHSNPIHEPLGRRRSMPFERQGEHVQVLVIVAQGASTRRFPTELRRDPITTEKPCRDPEEAAAEHLAHTNRLE
nr:hypothetical protein [Thermoleophilum album]